MAKSSPASQAAAATAACKDCIVLKEHVVEIVSDSGEGAQTAGQAFATISARMGNGVWTVEIIPAEIEPPPRTSAGASGIRIRTGSMPITNAGDAADLIVAFNEQALLGRIKLGNIKKGCLILLDDKWRDHPDNKIAAEYAATCQEITNQGYTIREIPLEKECIKHVENPRRGKKHLHAWHALQHLLQER